MINSNALVVFLKAPVPGDCKTRLAPPFAPSEAADLYRAFCLDIFESVRRVPAALWIAYQAHPDFPTPAWIMPKTPFFLQSGATLGDRLIQAFETLFQKGHRRVVAIGTDAPSLPAKNIRRAFNSLRKNKLVLGPAEDGGYYLAGLSEMQRGIFRNIPWSTDDVLSKTRRAAQREGWKAVELAAHYDVDDFSGLDRLEKDLKKDPRLCPHTRRKWEALKVNRLIAGDTARKTALDGSGRKD